MASGHNRGNKHLFVIAAPFAVSVIIVLFFLFFARKMDSAAAYIGVTEQTWQNEEKVRVRDYANLMDRVERLGSDRLVSSEIGHVDAGNGGYKIRLVSFRPLSGNGSMETDAFRVLIVGGIHGHEIAGSEAAMRFAEDIVRRPTRYPNAHIDIIPVLNPWGWEHNMRHNYSGMDINRDFSSERTKEAEIFRLFSGEEREYDLFIDLHESYKQGYFLYDYSSPPDGELWKTYRSLITLSNKPLENRYREFLSRTKDGILHIRPLQVYVNMLRGRLSIDGYMALRRVKRLYVIETPLREPYIDRLRLQLRTIHALIAYHLRPGD